MDRFQEMRTFVRIAQRQSFSQAAADLQIPRSTASSLIQRLEARIGAKLLQRTTRQVRLTQEGESFLLRCTRLLNDLEELESTFSSRPPSGQLRVNLQGTLAKHFIMPKLGEFMARYPGIRLHIGESDRLVDPLSEGLDCVLRAGHLQDSSLRARRLALLPQTTAASPAYLDRVGIPVRLTDLQAHLAVDYVSNASSGPMTLEFTTAQGLVERHLNANVSVTGADLYTGAALAGLGLIQVPRYRIMQELARRDLVEVLPNMPPPPMPVSVLYPGDRQPAPRVEVFVRWLSTCFASPDGHESSADSAV